MPRCASRQLCRLVHHTATTVNDLGHCRHHVSPPVTESFSAIDLPPRVYVLTIPPQNRDESPQLQTPSRRVVFDDEVSDTSAYFQGARRHPQDQLLQASPASLALVGVGVHGGQSSGPATPRVLSATLHIAAFLVRSRQEQTRATPTSFGQPAWLSHCWNALDEKTNDSRLEVLHLGEPFGAIAPEAIHNPEREGNY